MKYIFILLAFIALASSVNAQRGGTDSLAVTNPIIVAIQNMDFSLTVGTTVDSLLQFMPAGYTLEIRASITSKKAAYLVLKYAPSAAVYITVREFNHMDPELINSSDPKQNWSISLFKMEKISFVVAFNGSCFNGCDNKFRLN
ncbi:MAG: hypothetical protein EOP48_07165 [Sphingobacteriales bacterium]|nr:MAG: hypothetical protein EOP48_07165 [Sphingobacteriales bacterium]